MNTGPSKKDVYTPMIAHLTDENMDLAIDYMEMGLDSFLSEGILKDIPIIGTAWKLGQNVMSIKNLITARNYWVFISELRKDKVTAEKLEEHFFQLNSNPKQLKKELEMLLIYIDRYNEVEKAQYLANIYRCFLKQSVFGIDWETATAFFEILDRVLLQDLSALKTVCTYGTRKEYFNEHSSLLRLSALGLLQYFNGKEEAYGHNKIGLARLTVSGKAFYRTITTSSLI